MASSQHNDREPAKYQVSRILERVDAIALELAPEGSVLAQIKVRGYADKYRAEKLPIHLLGIEFSRE